MPIALLSREREAVAYEFTSSMRRNGLIRVGFLFYNKKRIEILKKQGDDSCLQHFRPQNSSKKKSIGSGSAYFLQISIIDEGTCWLIFVRLRGMERKQQRYFFGHSLGIHLRNMPRSVQK